ncbi:MAG: hypothetical protein O2968_02330 [Acidobacteria bacterium]|nr:hypothetical protein [Acidobacteriota bacterium]
MAPVTLTEEEQALLDQIEFTEPPRSREAGAVQRSGEAACRLMHSLLSREAIPPVRLDFFTNPDLHGGISPKMHFGRKGKTGDEIFRDGNFLKYLHYFLYGPKLPSAVIEAFQKAIVECGDVTSGDLPELWRLAKDLTRSHGLDSKQSKEVEFYKLSLESGLDESDARSIREAVRKVG